MSKRTLADMSNSDAFSIICMILIMFFNFISIPRFGNILPYCIKGV